MKRYSSAKDMFNDALEQAPIFDFVGSIDAFTEENALIETELFDEHALKYYAKKFTVICLGFFPQVLNTVTNTKQHTKHSPTQNNIINTRRW